MVEGFLELWRTGRLVKRNLRCSANYSTSYVIVLLDIRNASVPVVTCTSRTCSKAAAPRPAAPPATPQTGGAGRPCPPARSQGSGLGRVIDEKGAASRAHRKVAHDMAAQGGNPCRGKTDASRGCAQTHNHAPGYGSIWNASFIVAPSSRGSWASSSFITFGTRARDERRGVMIVI